jgi:hypothetical protein
MRVVCPFYRLHRSAWSVPIPVLKTAFLHQFRFRPRFCQDRSPMKPRSIRDGDFDHPPKTEEMRSMKALVEQAMINSEVGWQGNFYP